MAFAPAHYTPIKGQAHLGRAFEYILDQERHHGLNSDPFHEASNLPDLLGLRVLGRHTVASVRRHLPRVRRDHLLQFLPPVDLERDPDVLAALSVLGDAVGAAVARPSSRGSPPDVIAARAAAAGLFTETPMPFVARALRVSAQRLRRNVALQLPPPELREAVRGQVRLRAGVPLATRV